VTVRVFTPGSRSTERGTRVRRPRSPNGWTHPEPPFPGVRAAASCRFTERVLKPAREPDASVEDLF
jgi:hypothetical protein